jgi:hypothetical protein
MFKIKTPHRKPFWHMLKMLVLFLFAAIMTLVLHLGAAISSHEVHLSGATVVALRYSFLTTAAVSLLAGIIVTATLRRAFNLVQTGRLVQYSGFCLSSWLGLQLSAYFFGAITLTAPIVASFALFAIAFGLATALGEVPWRGRTWLPMAKKKTAPRPSDQPQEGPGQDSNKKG